MKCFTMESKEPKIGMIIRRRKERKRAIREQYYGHTMKDG